MMTAFETEKHADSDLISIVTRDAGNGGRTVLFSGSGNECHNVMRAIRVAYNRGRRDEAAVRSAAFAGIASSAPMGVA